MVTAKVLFALPVVIVIVGLPLNGAVLVGLTYDKFWMIPSAFLLFNLSLVDILSCIMIASFLLPHLTTGACNFGSSDYNCCLICQTRVVMLFWLMIISMHIMPAMSLDRLIYIKKPIQYDKWVTIPPLTILLFAIWIISLLLPTAPLYGFGGIGFSKDVGACISLITSLTKLGPSYMYVLFVLIELIFPFSILFVTNIWLLFIILKGLKSCIKIKIILECPKHTSKSRIST